MKKLIALIFAFLLYLPSLVNACTTFLINTNGQMVFGRNYDWVSSSGMVCTNLRGLSKSGLISDGGTPATWTSKFGSITFNQYGKEFPTGGMNEKGLVVELMWADGTKYPTEDKRASIGLLGWIQYQLDNHYTIEEVVASDAKIRISPNNPPCHFLVADANGKAATIEFYNGKLVMHKGNDLPFAVLTNNTYQESVAAAKSADVAKGNTKFSFQNNSLQRFTTACSMVQQYQNKKIDKPVVDYAFDILKSVAQDDYTVWSIVYDITNKQVQFKTVGFKEVKILKFESFDFSCKAQALSLNMNQKMKGDVKSLFQPFTTKLNREILTKSVEDSKKVITIPDEAKEANLSYAEAVSCKTN